MRKRDFPEERIASSKRARVFRSISPRKNSSDQSINDNEGHIDWWNGQTFHDRYVVEKLLGVGTFGKVLYCKDLKHNDHVAIKVIRRVAKYIESAEIETEILDDIYCEQKRSRKFYCVKLYSTFRLNGYYFMVFQPLGLSLYDIIKRNDYVGLPLSIVKSVSKQLLCALDFLQSMNLIHTDLKLENILFVSNRLERYSIFCPRKQQDLNILVPSSSSIKLIDFGGATYDYASKTAIINTRQYRGPEVILEAGWSYPSDVWSAGCIIAEISDGELLFATHDDLEHLTLMERVLGQKLPSELIKTASSYLRQQYFSENHALRSELLPYESVEHIRCQSSLEAIFSYYDNLDHGFGLLHLLKSLLQLNPKHRITPETACQLEFFSRD